MIKCYFNSRCDCSCPVWQEITTNLAYKAQNGFHVPTMTGQKEPLLFRCLTENSKNVIHVWRAEGGLDFTFNEHDCCAICQRFEEGLNEGRNFEHGGTAFFNALDWQERPLTIITAPYAAAIIRYARRKIGLRI